MPDHHKELLDLGPKFVPVHNRIPYMDIISNTESTALKFDSSSYDTKNDTALMKLRQEILIDLKTAKAPKTNLNKNQQKALKELKSDENIKIYPFDKGAGLVRISKSDAIKKIEEQIGNTEIIEKDPTPCLARKFQSSLRELNKQGKFTKTEYNQLYPSDPIPPRMYGTVKAHKPEKNYPMRIVVSTIGTPSYKTSEYLVKIIQPTLNKNKTRLKNSQTFVQNSETWLIEEDEVQVSYDVVNLYPSVPVKEAINIIIQILSSDADLKNRTKLDLNDIKALIELCLSKCYFLWEDKIYLLNNSAPIGLALMVVIAEAYLQYHEKNAIDAALRENPPVAPKSFVRYVDDSHARFKNLDSATAFQRILNQQDPVNIKYTMDIEDNQKSLQFLDLDITNNKGTYEYKIYRKNAITNVQVKPHSGHDPKTLKGIFTGFLHRAYTVCKGQHQKDEINFLISCFTENGYDSQQLKEIVRSFEEKRSTNRTPVEDSDEPSKIITLPWIPGLSPKLRKTYRKHGYKAVFKSSANLKTILTSSNKSRLPKNSHPGVYMVSCKCEKRYVGETKLKVSTRIKQHERTIKDKKWDSSGVSFHAKTCKEGFDWENTSTLKIEDRRFDRKVREALEIQFRETSPRNEHGLNQDDGQYVTTTFWKPMLAYFQEKSLH